MTTKKKPKLFGETKPTKKLSEFVSGKAESENTRVMVYLDKALHRRSRIWCAENGRSLSGLVEELLEGHLKALA